MDIYEYINSKVIRAYLRKEQYSFDPLQCAFLVYQSRRHTLEEKHAAWQEIIDTMPDMPVPERMNCVGWESLHAMLRDYMAMENKQLARPKRSKRIPHEKEAETNLKHYSFFGLWFDIPIPFKKGDLVCDCFRKEPFVLMGTTPWYFRQNPPKRDLRWHTDSSDMDAHGYRPTTAEAYPCDDYRCDYMNLQYYHAEKTE